jgi:hypothetical protein
MKNKKNEEQYELKQCGWKVTNKPSSLEKERG